MSLPRLEGPRRIKEDRKRLNAEDYKDYLERKKIDDLDIYYEGCSRDWDQDFTNIAKLHGDLKNNIALEFMESWPAEETKRVGVRTLFERGIENAREAFPGHSLVVVPHMNRNGCFHTHVLFCTVSDEGKRLLDKGINRRRWNKVCDKRSRENGLSTVQRTTSKQREKLSRDAHKMLRRGIIPYQYQIMQKADFARRIATNMDRYIELMGQMGIEVRVRGKKTISYKHEAREIPVRGRYIGLNYTMGGLNETFEKNKTEFRARSRLERSLEEKLRIVVDPRGQIVGDTSEFPFHSGGHQKFKTTIGAEVQFIQNRELEIKSHNRFADLVYQDIQISLSLAKAKSIPEYCQKHGIPLNKNEDGSFTLKGREHILIRGNEWKNVKVRNGKKVGTKGSLIEFVANHKKMTLLESLADITGNSKILLLEQYLGKEKRTFQEFHVPRQHQKNEKESISALGELVGHFGYKSRLSQDLFKLKNVQARTDGTIRFILGEKAIGAIDFKQDENGKWQKKLIGSLRYGFLKQNGTSKTLKLFKDPLCFMSETGGKGKMAFKSGDSLLVLGDGGHEALDFFLANNPKTTHVELFGFESKELSKTNFLELKKHGITFQFMESNRKQRGKGLDLTR